MYKVLLNQPGRLALRVADFITVDDYYELRPLLDTTLHSAGEPRLYWEMEYFRGWQPDELWRDLQFDLTVTADFARIALVGTPDNVSLITPVMQTIFRAEMRTFPPDQKEAAWQWFGDSELPRLPTK
ncbi:SpoIIAA family protein [Spirosoma sordidisoli]|uniref:STAS/SEC14 domain-containing protein n=1 Tax=Spirosoma sordidisoli TaxID=2502893 RepID=A0A4Q2UBM7_9BACT|nr:STAS/SEC14 domain-containing protein [Spirosoma sordidisoli]RYC66453.1 STAS/SEC14 domain-containing protein [Spirosoma sordidisoli]